MLGSSGNDSRDCVYNMLRVLSKQKIGLNIVHINAQSLGIKIDEFRYLFTSSKIDIICISETWFPFDISDSVFNLDGFKLFRSDRTTLVDNIETRAKGGGVAVYVRNGISCKVKLRTDIGSEIEYIFLDISTADQGKLLLASVYRPNRNINIFPFISILEEISIQYNDVIIIGDFNNNLFVDNPLIAPMLSLHFTPVNTSVPTHFTSTSTSLIDLVFVNHGAKILLYDQISAPCFSNHDLLFLTYDISTTAADQLISYRDFRNIDYASLYHYIDNIVWDQIYELNSVNDQLSFIQDNVSFLFDMSVPIRTKMVRADRQPWFNDNLKNLIKIRDDSYTRWKRFRTDDLRNIYKLARRHVNKHIRLAKINFYKEKFSSAIDSRSKWREIRRIGIGRKGTKTCKMDTDVNLLNNQFVNLNVPSAVNNVYEDLCYVSVENPFSFRCVDNLEVLECITSTKSDAVGSDNLNPKFLRALTPKLLPYYTYLFNSVLTKSTFPSEWKKSRITPIPKNDNDFRPIAILPFLSKIMETIMAKQINQYLEKNNLLSIWQSGFIRHKSCTTALLDVSENLRTELDKNCAAFLVLLDHSKAFDSVNHGILVTKLEKLFYFSGSACKLIDSYLFGRSQYVHMNNNISTSLDLTRGVPQGSVLGPLLFCLYINDLPDALVNCRIHMYADDIQLYIGTRFEDVRHCIDLINNDLNRVDSWATANALCINPSKSKCLFISRSKRTVDIPAVVIRGSKINFVQKASNLGIVFNSWLTWSDHINVTVGRVHAMLRNLWVVIDSTPFNIRMQLAKAYLIPVLLYGCEIFASCDSDDRRKLNVAYNNIARYVFLKRRRDHISLYSYRIFNIGFENLLKIKCLILLHKIIIFKRPVYLHCRIQLARSNRGRKIIQQRFRTLLSQRQFFIYSTSLWNSLPNHTQNISNAHSFKKQLYEIFS